MKSTIWKSTLREIRESMGRFLAIWAIIALGVAFFAGLTITKSAMVKTGEAYLEKQGFYDYRILSTTGFRQEEVEHLAKKEEVEAAEGAIAFDIIYQEDTGNDCVLKAHSITEKVNQIKLVEGRMPKEPYECVVDANFMGKADIGKKIKLSENNAKEDLKHFAYDEYTVVGTVLSPLYIQFERGSTAIGSGKLSGFFYILPEGFAMDYYTEVYVNFTEDFPLYSDEYKEFIDTKLPWWEEYAKESAILSYQGILADAKEQFADAKEELEAQKADAKQELEDVRQQLDDAKEQLQEGELQLQEAKEELADAVKALEKKEQELASAEMELPKQEKELADGEKALEEGKTKWEAGKAALAESKLDLLMAQVKLEEQKSDFTEKEAFLRAGAALLQQSQEGLAARKQALEEENRKLEEQEKLWNTIYGEGNVPAGLLESISAQRAANAEKMQQIDAELAELEPQRKELEAGETALAEGKAVLASYEKQLRDGLAQITAGEKELEGAWTELEANQKKLAEGNIAIEAAKQQLKDGKEQLSDAREELNKAEQTLLEKEQELAEGREVYEEGLKEYEDGSAEFHEKIADAEQELANAEKDILSLEEPDCYVLGRDTNVGYVCFENDSAIIEGIAKVFPVFFFLVAALVCITTMNRMVEEQRTQIGVLKALGYSEGTIMVKYMFYSGTAAIAGCIIGYVGGTLLFPNVIWYAYGIMYRMDRLLYVFDWKLALISMVMSVLCSIGATWFSCRAELSQVAAQLMRPKAPKAGKRIFLEYVPFIWSRLKFLNKVSIRNILRYKKRLFMMVMGISGCTALLVTGFGVKDSIANVVSRQYGEIQLYDMNLVLKEGFSQQDAKRIATASGLTQDMFVPVCEDSYDLVTEQGRKALNLVIFDSKRDMTPFLGLYTEENERLHFPGAGEAVLTEKLAKNYNLQVGDVITLQNEDMQTISVLVTGICRNYISNYAYISGETYEQQLGEAAEYKNVYLNLPADAAEHQISARLMQEENVVTVSVNADMLLRLNGMMQSLNLIVVVIILCAGSLAFIVLYNLTNINITERIREIATIQVLGFNKKETESYVFNENMVLVGMGAIVGMILGHYLHLFVMNEVSIDLVTFDIHVRPISYGYSVLLTFVFAWLVNRMMGRKLEQINMTESLKSVD